MADSRYRRNRIAARTRTALLAALGSLGFGSVVVVVILAITLAWFGDGLLLLVPEQLRVLLALAAFPLLAGSLLVLSRSMPAPAFRFTQDRRLTQRRAVILFLSPPGSEVLAANLFTTEDLLSSETTREKFGSSPWRMCAEGLAVHGDALEYVVAVCSADSVGVDGQRTVDGSYRYADLFRSTFGNLFLNENRPDILLTPDEGVDFENASDLGLALEGIVRRLERLGVPERDMIVDVTGGSKVWSAVAGIVALGESRSFQYVSQRDYCVHPYDITPEV